MGDHLIRPAAPEFNGNDFEHTWIWGRQGGRITFWEPMITIDFFNEVRANVANNGWYNGALYLGMEVDTTEGNGIIVPISGLTTADGDPITQEEAGLYPTSFRLDLSRVGSSSNRQEWQEWKKRQDGQEPPPVRRAATTNHSFYEPSAKALQ